MRRNTLIFFMVLWAALPVVALAQSSREADPARRSNVGDLRAPIDNRATITPPRRSPADERVQPDNLAIVRSMLGERGAPIEVREATPKREVATTRGQADDYLAPRVEPPEWAQRRAAWQPGGERDMRPIMAERFQSRLRDAAAVAATRQNEFNTAPNAGFGSINRFVMRRNQSESSSREGLPAIPAGGKR
jgi:hypothetical protein